MIVSLQGLDESREKQTESNAKGDGGAVVAPIEGLIVHGESFKE
jgi:hypothetical protein